MNNKVIYSILGATLTMGGLTSCNDFLDKMPDNRTTIDSEDKVVNMLVSAYPTTTALLVAELSSDNSDDNGVNNTVTERFVDQAFNWEDITEDNNDAPEGAYEDAYSNAASANAALEGIEAQGGATTEKLRQAKAEALLCRAYAHFRLVTMFSHAYNGRTSDKDLGMPYSTEPETKVHVSADRGTVAETYAKIAADIEEALPLVGDANYTVPKYHFNKNAALAFATRFYLYYEKWDKAVQYATQLLGSKPASMLRDNRALRNMNQDFDAVCDAYVSEKEKANLLLSTTASNIGYVFGPYRVWSKYSHSSHVSYTEGAAATNIYGGSGSIIQPLKMYSATNLDKHIFFRFPFKFEYTDPVAGIGYRRSIVADFTTDEALLNRAEAYILLKQYDNAVADLNTWMHNFTSSRLELNVDTIQNFYKKLDYSYSDSENPLEGTIKKKLNPYFDIDGEGSVQESLLQCVLSFRRVECLQTGLRWNDIKRYNIRIPRRVLNASATPVEATSWLEEHDERMAWQLPIKVAEAGMEKNPRTK